MPWCLGALVPWCLADHSFLGDQSWHIQDPGRWFSHLPRIPVTIGEAQDTGHCLGSEAAEARRGHHALIMIPGPDHGKQEKNHGYGSQTNFFDFLCWDQHPFMKFMSYFDKIPGHYTGLTYPSPAGMPASGIRPQRPKIVPHLEDSIDDFFPAITSIWFGDYCCGYHFIAHLVAHRCSVRISNTNGVENIDRVHKTNFHNDSQSMPLSFTLNKVMSKKMENVWAGWMHLL